MGNIIDVLWKNLLGCFNALLPRTNNDTLVMTLLKCFQSATYSAGAIGVVTARDGFLSSLCGYTLMSSSEQMGSVEANGRWVSFDWSVLQDGEGKVVIRMPYAHTWTALFICLLYI